MRFSSNIAAASNHVELSDAFADRIVALRKLMRPRSARNGTMVRIGRDNDGGYVMLDHGLRDAIAYSIGISDDVSWDADMAARGCQVFQYDHTIDGLPHYRSGFAWKKQGLSETGSSTGILRTIEHMIADNGHENQRSMVLKCDAEGAEWGALLHASRKTLRRFSQIVIEVHSFDIVSSDAFFDVARRALAHLNRTHQIVHVHGNNCGLLVTAGEQEMPSAMELTYVRRSDHWFSPCTSEFPTALDMPCTPVRPDIYLGQLGLVERPWAGLWSGFKSTLKPRLATQPT